MKRTLFVLAAVLCLGAAALSSGCGRGRPGEADYVTGPSETLPERKGDGEMTLNDALESRRSTRSFSEEELTDDEVARLLWAAQGVSSPSGYRTAPSAGALYPLEIYVVRGGGLYHYLPDGNATEKTGEGIDESRLAAAALGQPFVGAAPAVFVVAAVFERTASRYGERAERYVYMEAGHAAQNLLLEAAALGLGAVPVGAFSDERVGEVLGLPPGQVPLYLIPVGHRR